MIDEKNRKSSSDFFRDDFYRKRPSESPKLPQYVQENLPVLASLGAVSIGIFLFYLISVLLADDPTKPPTNPLFQARLTMPVGAKRIYAPGTENILNKLEVKVKNVGLGEALNVWVDAEVNGAPFPMAGPLRLRAGEEAVYTVEGSVEVQKAQDVKVTSSCWNCPTKPGPPPDIGEILAWRQSEQSLKGEAVR